MTNQLKNKSKTLLDLLAQSGLTKEAAQEITHKTLLDQTNIGKEQTQDLHEGVEGVLADTKAAENKSTDTVPDLPGVQDLNASGEEGIRDEGKSVETQTTDGCDAGTPAQEAKKMASDYRAAVASLVAAKRAQVKQASEQPKEQEFTTGTAVMAKFAALTQNSTEADIEDAKQELLKLASTNPAFGVIKERIMMRKMAEDIDALAEAEGISPEQAAEELQAAADANPEMGEELEDEATGEAVADLADAEAATGDLMAGIDEMAANASANLGVEVSPEDIMQAADEVVAMAEEQGVEPEAILQAAIEQMQSAGGEEDVSEEDMAAAEEILAQAAEQGISPEEVISALSDDLGGEAAPAEAAAPEVAPEAAPAEETPAEAPAEAPAEGGSDEGGSDEGSDEGESSEDKKDDEGEKDDDESEPAEKVASVQQKRASTDRAAYVQYLRHLKK